MMRTRRSHCSIILIGVALSLLPWQLGMGCPQVQVGDPLPDGGADGGADGGGPAAGVVAGSVGCLQYVFGVTPAQLLPASVAQFSISLQNICPQPVLLTGRLYVTLTGMDGQTVPVPNGPIPQRVVQVPPNGVVTAADFHSSLAFAVSDAAYWPVFAQGDVMATGIFDGQVSGGDNGGSFSTAVMVLRLAAGAGQGGY